MIKTVLMACPLLYGLGWFLGGLLDDNSQVRKYIDDYFKGAQNPVPRTTTTADDQDTTEFIMLEKRQVPPAHLLTKIESFSLLSEYGIEKYETGVFQAGDYKWRVIIYPDGNESQNKGDHVSVYLAMADTSSLPVDWELYAIFTIFLYDQFSDNYLCFRGNVRRFHTTKSKWGFPKFMSKKSLRDQSSGYLVNDNIVIGAEVFVLKKQRIIESVTLLKPDYGNLRNWKIVGFSKLEGVWVSEEFAMRDVEWKMKLYPNGDFNSNGDSSSKGDSVSMSLVCVSAERFTVHQKVKAEFHMRLLGRSDHDSGKLSHWFTSSSTCCGQSAFISLAKLSDPKNGFLVDDCCTVQVQISVQLVA